MDLEKMTSLCRITILNLENCSMSGQDAGRLAGVLAQCPALSRLNLDKNQLGAEGAGSLAEVLPKGPSLFVVVYRPSEDASIIIRNFGVL